MSETDSNLSYEMNQIISKLNQGINNESKFQRVKALESVKKQMNDFLVKIGDTSLAEFDDKSTTIVLKNLLTVWNDKAEKCRELSIETVQLILLNASKFAWTADMTSMLIMAVAQRLCGKEILETSEEIRLQMINLVSELVDRRANLDKSTFEIHFQELVTILVNAINDSFPEIKKKGCSCTRSLAISLSGSVFHMQSETFIKPLLANMTHQHSRVRRDIIDCLCVVVCNGNNKSVGDVVPHLAQRLFDENTMVRMAVIKLVGTWLLDLVDRYSFFHRLIPLLLSGFIDESLEVIEIAESLWWDVGMKYHKENEDDLKDKANFLDADLPNYPVELKDKRPNLGCRELLKSNLSKILPGILNDVGDWLETTRIKSIRLLYITIWQGESNIIQNLETVLQTLFKASGENLKAIQNEIFNCARLLGHFTDPTFSMRLVLETIRRSSSSPSTGAINILNGLLTGFDSKQMPCVLVTQALELIKETSLTADNAILVKLAESCRILTPIDKYEQALNADENSRLNYNYLVFKITLIISALTTDLACNEMVTNIIKDCNLDETTRIRCIENMTIELNENCQSWTDNSFEPILFAKLVEEYGLYTNTIEKVARIFKDSLEPSKDPQMRTRFLLLIPKIFLLVFSASSASSNRQSFSQDFFEDVISNMLMPNIIWKAGRAANAVRLSSIASLLLILQSQLIESMQIRIETIVSILKIMLTCLDDENKTTRLYVCKIFYIILKKYGHNLDRDHLHSYYTEFIKRMDDQIEEIRFEMLKTFSVYIDCLKKNNDYDAVLYGAHIQKIYESLLLYLDDPDIGMQTKVFELIKKASSLSPKHLSDEIEKVKSKQRNQKYCIDLIKCCQEQGA